MQYAKSQNVYDVSRYSMDWDSINKK